MRRRKRMIRWAGVAASSAASLFAAHTAHGKPLELKEMEKTAKKYRSEATPSGDWFSPGEYTAPTAHVVRQYPWRLAIVTTTFWVGEKPTPNNPVPNHKSSWDPAWAANYGGTDTPDRKERTAEFIPADFIPRQNPFYVALPYNDMTASGHKDEASRIIPWYGENSHSADRSVCKGRWIAIRRGNKICYAQWEDAGPFRTDNWQYVFGNERPRPNLNQGAGLDVSPAVRDFLGMDDSDMTDWKFVEFEDVPSGPWSVYGDNNTFVINRRAAEQRQLALLKLHPNLNQETP